jgi:2-oxoglutarate dehydrogenase E1 component
MSDSSTPSAYTAYQGNTYLFGGNAPYVEEMYENYLANPGSVPDNWRSYFDALQNVPAGDGTNTRDVPHLPVINAFAERAKQGGTKVVVASGADSELGRKRTAVQQLIAAYRNVGARWADLDPLKRAERPPFRNWNPRSTASPTPTSRRCSTPATPSSARTPCPCATC